MKLGQRIPQKNIKIYFFLNSSYIILFIIFGDSHYDNCKDRNERENKRLNILTIH